VSDRVERHRRLTPEQKWQVFLEATRKNTTDAEVCRRWGITPWQLRAIRERVKEEATDALARGPGRPRRDRLLDHDVARAAAPIADLGPGRRDGPARSAAHRHRPRRLLLRPAEPWQRGTNETPTGCASTSRRARI